MTNILANPEMIFILGSYSLDSFWGLVWTEGAWMPKTKF